MNRTGIWTQDLNPGFEPRISINEFFHNLLIHRPSWCLKSVNWCVSFHGVLTLRRLLYPQSCYCWLPLGEKLDHVSETELWPGSGIVSRICKDLPPLKNPVTHLLIQNSFFSLFICWNGNVFFTPERISRPVMSMASVQRAALLLMIPTSPRGPCRVHGAICFVKRLVY